MGHRDRRLRKEIAVTTPKYVVRCIDSDPEYEREAKNLAHAQQLLDHFNHSYCKLPHEIVIRELVDGKLRTTTLNEVQAAS